jgi:diguanylate cyclase (GGDEF)-like protein/PAS domain S-box-containing protein
VTSVIRPPFARTTPPSPADSQATGAVRGARGRHDGVVRPWSTAALALGGVGTTALVLWHLFAQDAGVHQTAGTSVGILLITLLAGALTGSAASDQQTDADTRRGWLGIGLSLVCVVTAQLLHLVGQLAGNPGALAPVARIAMILLFPVLLSALLCWPQAPRGRQERVKFALDIAIVATASAAVGWYDLTSGGLRQLPILDAIELHGMVAGDLIALLTVSLLWQRAGSTGRWMIGADMPRPLALLALSLVLHFLADLSALLLAHLPDAHPSDWPRAIRPLAVLAMAGAAWSQRHGRRTVLSSATPSSPTVLSSAIPFIVTVPTFAVSLLTVSEYSAGPMAGLLIGAALLTVLSFLRVSVATRETIAALAQSAARDGEARFRALVHHANDLIVILDLDTTIRWISPSLARLFALRPGDVVGRPLLDLIHAEDRANAEQFLETLAAQPMRSATEVERDLVPPLQCEWRMTGGGGRWHTVDTVGTNLLAEPTVRGLVLTSRDVTERRVIEEQYMHQAFHDPLTDLANRALFLYQVGHALARGARQGHAVAVLFLDLDHFKEVNDSLGHANGDRLLVEAARRLSSCVRGSDLIARLGGDEFAVLAEGAENEDEIVAMADRIVDALAAPFTLDGKEVFISTSIGIARAQSGETTDEVVRNADVAMYLAKTRGKGRWELFAPHMQHAAVERLELEADLRRAIDRQELSVEYQAIVDLRTGSIEGAEALVRWHRSERGTVPPSVFIPIAEETGLMLPISQWVLQQVVRQAADWEREFDHPMRITMNLSGRHLQDECIIDDVRTALAESRLSPNLLVLELGERTLTVQSTQALERLHALRELGVAIAIDDFGTGVSSLSTLQRYPIDILKIDRAFVDKLGDGPEGATLARAIIALANTLTLETLAEGVETEAQRGTLLSLGCTSGQGYLFSAPISPIDFTRLVQTRGLLRITRSAMLPAA